MNDVVPSHSPQDNLNAQRPPDFGVSAPKPAARTRARFRLPLMLIGGGVTMFVLGTAPLLLTILFAALGWTSDPNPNSVGFFGILAMCTFWPSLGLILAGGVIAAVRWAG